MTSSRSEGRSSREAVSSGERCLSERGLRCPSVTPEGPPWKSRERLQAEPSESVLPSPLWLPESCAPLLGLVALAGLKEATSAICRELETPPQVTTLSFPAPQAASPCQRARQPDSQSAWLVTRPVQEEPRLGSGSEGGGAFETRGDPRECLEQPSPAGGP